MTLLLSETSVAPSTDSGRGKRPNKGGGKDVMPGTSRSDGIVTAADAGAINRGGIRAADLTCAGVTNYTTLFTDYRTLIVAPSLVSAIRVV